MKIWPGGVILIFLFTLLVLRYGILENTLAERLLQSRLSHNSSEQLEWVASEDSPAIQNPGDGYSIASANEMAWHLCTPINLSEIGNWSLQTWYHLGHVANHSTGLPHAIEAIAEASSAWESLMAAIEGKNSNKSNPQKDKDKQCPYSIKNMNASEFANDTFRLKIPCGLIQGSSITLIGTPEGLLGNFRIDLVGTPLLGEPDPPIIFHCNVRLQGDKLTEDPVIVQNAWSAAKDWGAEERCPSSSTDGSKIVAVDDLEGCSSIVGNDENRGFISNMHHNISNSSLNKEGDKQRKYFPFKQGFLFIATIRVGIEGIQMTVDGRHITSFAFRESLEPWLVSEVRISGDIKLISILASGLPTSEDSEHVIDLELLKSNPIIMHQAVQLFIGIFSTANNFKQRMAVRRTWMQYDAVRTRVVVRFFVGLHKNLMVNEELWDEAGTYGDIQLMPFVDYYSLITLKTIAICIYGTNIVSAKYIMKTDDDAFVRVDEVLSSLAGINITSGLLYGRINSYAQPHRNVESKWYISIQEWPDEKYPPWAHGPGYAVSHDIAESVYKQHKEGSLRMFKLEDVAMGIWIEEMKKKGSDIKYVNEERINIDGCEAGYVLAHYQEPREMLCLWQKFQETKQARCCGE